MVDNPSGVNSYAEGALALNQGRRNDSKLWTTSLRKDRVLGMDSVQRFMAASNAARAALVPPGGGDTVLFTRHKPKSDANAHPDATTGTAPSKGEKGTTARAPPPSTRGRGPQPLFKKTSDKVRCSDAHRYQWFTVLHLSHAVRQQHAWSRTGAPPMLVPEYVNEMAWQQYWPPKGHQVSGQRWICCTQPIKLGIWNWGQTSPEVQNRVNSGPEKRPDVPQKLFLNLYNIAEFMLHQSQQFSYPLFTDYLNNTQLRK